MDGAEVSDSKHQPSGSGDDAYHTLDTIERLPGAVSAPQAVELAKVKGDLLRQKWGEQARRRAGAEGTARIEGDPAAGLPPWREVIAPHPDVAKGNFVQAQARRRPVAGVALRRAPASTGTWGSSPAELCTAGRAAGG